MRGLETNETKRMADIEPVHTQTSLYIETHTNSYTHNTSPNKKIGPILGGEEGGGAKNA